MTNSTAKAHRLLAPRIAYLIGTRDRDGTYNVIPVSNVTSVSTDPQHLPLAVHKQWRTYETLLSTEGFTLSVPLIGHLQGAWKLGARYSRYPAKTHKKNSPHLVFLSTMTHPPTAQSLLTASGG